MPDEIKRTAADELHKAIDEIRTQPVEGALLEAAAARVWARLSTEPAMPVVEKLRGCADFEALLPAYRNASLPPARAWLMQDHLQECVHCRQKYQTHAAAEDVVTAWAPPSRIAPGRSLAETRFSRYALAAAVLLAVGISSLLAYNRLYAAPSGPRATVQSVDGVLYRLSPGGEQIARAGDQLAEGERVRTAAGSHAFIRLFDGSVVEMNEKAGFSVSAGHNSTVVALDQGNIIVQAAKRHTGHLYVDSLDCRISVTGTVFSVNSATKGSRVAVLEGEVRVAQNGNEAILHSGDEYGSRPNLKNVPIADEIAWSRNLDRYLALLSEFSKLQHQLEAIPSPRLHYSSAILPRLPAGTVVYASIPNYGDALGQAWQIFQDQMRNSAVLQQWWQKAHPGNGPTPEELIQKMRDLSQYLGDEIVFTASLDDVGRGHPILIAQPGRPGIRDFVQTEADSLRARGAKGAGVRTFMPDTLAAATASSIPHDEMLVLVRPDFLLFAFDLGSLQRMNSHLASTGENSGGFQETSFGKRILESYSHGVSLLVAADLETLAARQNPSHSPRAAREELPLRNSGFKDVKYVLVERREVSGQPEHSAILAFNGERHGIASWLAAPAPMKSLEFVSDSASLVAAFALKNPALMFDDLQSIAFSANPRAEEHFSETESRLNLRLRDDLAATLGGDVSFALDGPMLPLPSWKIVAEVYDPGRLQNSLEALVRDHNQQAQASGKPEAHLEQEQIDSQVYHVFRSAAHQGHPYQVNYTFSGGYLIVAPTRAILMNTLRVHAQGTTLARSSSFRALLPSDQHANFSGIFYQNIGPALAPLTSSLNAQQMQMLQSLASDSKPSVVCAYGEPDQIQVVSYNNFLGLDLRMLALSGLFANVHKGGTGEGQNP